MSGRVCMGRGEVISFFCSFLKTQYIFDIENDLYLIILYFVLISFLFGDMVGIWIVALASSAQGSVVPNIVIFK